MTTPTPPPAAKADPAPLTLSIRLRPLEALRTVPRAATWIGLTLCALGAIALLVAWRQVAGLTEVGLQMPYLISGGLISVCLMIVGLLLISLDALAVESARRREQLTELRHMVSLMGDATKDAA